MGRKVEIQLSVFSLAHHAPCKRPNKAKGKINGQCLFSNLTTKPVPTQYQNREGNGNANQTEEVCTGLQAGMVCSNHRQA